ncbi:MAG: hypothetical protein ACKO96_28620 [Flammeovirgaceae bacterium]
MRYTLFFVAWLVSLDLSGQQVKKEYTLGGVDDSLRYSLTVNNNPANETTVISFQKNALKIFGVQEILSAQVHANSFLELRFRVRGGSGVKVRRNVLVCISHGQAYKAIDFLSEITSRVSTVYDKVADSLKLFDEKSDYHATLSIKQTEGKEYRAVLFESTKVESKYDPSQNVSFEKPYELYFDPSGYFFYNATKPLNKLYKMYLSRESKTVERFLSAEVPCIQLYQKLYLRIDNEWCIDNGHDSLSCL